MSSFLVTVSGGNTHPVEKTGVRGELASGTFFATILDVKQQSRRSLIG
jgi:hypothetical protein